MKRKVEEIDETDDRRYSQEELKSKEHTPIFIIRWKHHGSWVDDWDYESLSEIETLSNDEYGNDTSEAKTYVTEGILENEGLCQDQGTYENSYETMEMAERNMGICFDREVGKVRKAIMREGELNRDQYKDEYEEKSSKYENATDPTKIPPKMKPQVPKRPMSAFIMFSRATMASLKAKNQEIGQSKLCKVVSNMWKELSKEERQKYIEQEDKLRKKFSADSEEWLQSLEREREEKRHRLEEPGLRGRKMKFIWGRNSINIYRQGDLLPCCPCIITKISVWIEQLDLYH